MQNAESMFFRLQNLTLLLIILLVIILRFPSFFEPYWYGDELIRLLVAKEWFAGKTLYLQIFDNSPPALYLIFGIAPNIFGLKILAFVWVLIATIIFWHLASNFRKAEKLSKIYPVLAAVIFIFLTSTPILEGNIAAAELFALTPALAGLFLVWKLQTFAKTYQIILAGVLFAAATLIRIQAVTDFAAATLFLLVLKNFRSFFALFATFGFVWLLIFLIFFATGNWQAFFESVFTGNLNYVNYSNQFVIPFGLLIIKAVVLLFLLGILFKTRNVLGSSQFFILLWLIFSFFGALVGGRNYAHYFLQVTPAAALLSAQILRLKLGSLTRFLAITSTIVAFLILGYLHSRPFSYYKNFFNFFYNYPKYVNWFDPRVLQSRQIAKIITAKTDPGDKILVLGNAPEIYLIAKRKPWGKYVVSYHLNFQKQAREKTLANFSQEPPEIVVVTKEGRRDFPKLAEVLPKTYQLAREVGGGEIWERKF